MKLRGFMWDEIKKKLTEIEVDGEKYGRNLYEK